MTISKENEFPPIEVSRNFVGRAAFEFLSLSWMIDELGSKYHQLIDECKNRDLCEGRAIANQEQVPD